MAKSTKLIRAYQEYLLGKSNDFPTFFAMGSVVEAEKEAKAVLRYVVEDILGWTPQQMLHGLNKEVVSAFKLGPVLSSFILPEYAKTTDYELYAALLYPRAIKQSPEAMTVLRRYKESISSDQKRLPKGFFTDGDAGRERFLICLDYMISSSDEIVSVENAYAIFGGPKFRDFSRRHNRPEEVIQVHWSNPLEALHDVLPESEESELWYHVYLLSYKFRRKAGPRPAEDIAVTEGEKQ